MASDEQFMPKVNGNPFRCPGQSDTGGLGCGCNVFHTLPEHEHAQLLSDGLTDGKHEILVCNACGQIYETDRLLDVGITKTIQSAKTIEVNADLLALLLGIYKWVSDHPTSMYQEDLCQFCAAEEHGRSIDHEEHCMLRMTQKKVAILQESSSPAYLADLP